MLWEQVGRRPLYVILFFLCRWKKRVVVEHDLLKIHRL